jgi:4-hydroxythreonine-4-phosphate dehydrogenase
VDRAPENQVVRPVLPRLIRFGKPAAKDDPSREPGGQRASEVACQARLAGKRRRWAQPDAENASRSMTTRIGIAIGDVTGIGPEVTLKALSLEPDDADTQFLILGDPARLRQLNRQLGLNLPFQSEEVPQPSARFALHDPLAEPLSMSLPAGASAAAGAALTFLTEGARRCLRGELDALVTAPVNKEAIIRSGQASFTGQTEFLSGLARTQRTAMMLLAEDDRGRWLRVALVTTHLPIRAVPSAITQAKVERAIELTAQACRDLGLSQARVAVCGLNPHAGEGGKMGTEELEVIGPAVQAAAQRGCDVAGPFAADTVFYHAYRGDYQAVVAMYHDQGLAPLKMIGFERGVNWTLGLPFIRTSPDHGTAYDIAGQGKANPSSMQAAIGLAKQLARR